MNVDFSCAPARNYKYDCYHLKRNVSFLTFYFAVSAVSPVQHSRTIYLCEQRKIMRKILAILIVLFPTLLDAQTKSPAAPQPLVFTHVTVIDMTDAKLKPEMTLIVLGNRISVIGKTEKVRLPKNAQVIDAAGKFLIPGLWDMHVHALYEGRPEFFFPMFVANGVTGIREMGSTLPMDSIGKIREQIANGKIVAPRFGAVAGKIFNGPQSSERILPEFMYFKTGDEARQSVKDYKRQGADFIKVYDLLSREMYFAIVD